MAKVVNAKKKLATELLPTAMFPPSAEYKKRAPTITANKNNQPGALVTQSFIEPKTASILSPKEMFSGSKKEDRVKEFKAFAAKIGISD